MTILLPEKLIAAARKTGLAARNRGVVLSSAESCTGGLIAAALTHWPGSSEWFHCGFVCYSNAAKTELLKVSPRILRSFGAVSEETAAAMCAGAGDFSLAVTGVAGPGADGGKPTGTVCFGWRCEDRVRAETRNFDGGREEVRISAAHHSLQTMEKLLREKSNS